MQTAIEHFESMLDQNPKNAMVRYALANEYLKVGRHEEAIEQLTAYLQLQEDEGAAYRMLGQAWEKLGRADEACQAYEKGVEQALKHGHPGMADEFKQYLEELGT